MPSSARSDIRAVLIPAAPATPARPAESGAEPRDAARDRGQAVVELALCLPVVLLVLLGVVQVAVVVRNELLVQHAAREAARAASVSAAPGAAASRAATSLASTGLDALDVRVSSGAGAGGVVRVVVTARTRTEVPLIGGLLGDVAHNASAVMALEPP